MPIVLQPRRSFREAIRNRRQGWRCGAVERCGSIAKGRGEIGHTDPLLRRSASTQCRGDVPLGAGAIRKGQPLAPAMRADAPPARLNDIGAEQVAGHDDLIAATDIAGMIERDQLDRDEQGREAAMHPRILPAPAREV